MYLKYGNDIIPIYNSKSDELFNIESSSFIKSTYTHNIIIKIYDEPLIFNKLHDMCININSKLLEDNLELLEDNLELIGENDVIICYEPIVEEITTYFYEKIITLNVVSPQIQFVDNPILHQRKIKIQKITTRIKNGR